MGLMRVYRTGHSKRVPRTLNGRVTRGSATPPRGPPGTPARAASDIRVPRSNSTSRGDESVKRVGTPAQGEKEAPNAYPWGEASRDTTAAAAVVEGGATPPWRANGSYYCTQGSTPRYDPGITQRTSAPCKRDTPSRWTAIATAVPTARCAHRHRPMRPPPPTVVPTATVPGAPLVPHALTGDGSRKTTGNENRAAPNGDGHDRNRWRRRASKQSSRQVGNTGSVNATGRRQQAIGQRTRGRTDSHSPPLHTLLLCWSSTHPPPLAVLAWPTPVCPRSSVSVAVALAALLLHQVVLSSAPGINNSFGHVAAADTEQLSVDFGS